MNIKKYICLAGLILPVVAMAQQDKTLCDFETPESYVSVRAYTSSLLASVRRPQQ